MVEHLELASEDVAVIAELIQNMIVKLVPNCQPSCHDLSFQTDHLCRSSSDVQTCEIVSCHWPTSRSRDFDTKAINGDFVLSNHINGEDQEKQESVMSDISAEYGVPIASDSKGIEPDFLILDECCEGSSVMYCGQDGHKDKAIQSENNSASSLVNSCCSACEIFEMSGLCSLTLADKDNSNELQLELDTIEMQYHECFRQLVKTREEAIENAKRKWITRKKISVI